MMDMSKNHEITDYYAADFNQSVDEPRVVITGAEASDEVQAGLGEAQLDTSVVGMSELRTDVEVYTPIDGQLPAQRVNTQKLDEIIVQPDAVHEDPSALALAAGTIAFSADQSTNDAGEQNVNPCEIEATTDYSAVITDDLGSESSEESTPDSKLEAQEDDGPSRAANGGGDDLDPPDDNSVTGAAEGDDNPDRAAEPISAANTRAIWDMGKILIDAQGESGPFPVGEFEDGTTRYDNEFPGMRIYEFPNDIVAEAGYPEGTEVSMSDTPPQYLDTFTEKYERYDPQLHSDPPDSQHLLQIRVDSEVDGVFYDRQFDIVMDPDGGLEANYTQRSGIIGGEEQRIPDKSFDEYTQQEMDDFLEKAQDYIQSMQDEGDFHGFSEADAARVLRLIDLAISREESS